MQRDATGKPTLSLRFEESSTSLLVRHDHLAARCYRAPAMTDTKTTAPTPDLDPAALARQNLLKRQRERMRRALLKRRRRKSGQ